jgi:formate/nitrite transporter
MFSEITTTIEKNPGSAELHTTSWNPGQPEGMDAYAPPEMARRVVEVGISKARMPLSNMFVLSILAGAFIALGANFFTVAVTGSSFGFGPTRLLGGLCFSLGLILVVVAGAELFTGNNLMTMAWASGHVRTTEVLRNWIVVFAGNFAGALVTAVIVYDSAQWQMGEQAIGATALRLAIAKVGFSFSEAFFRGMLCNALVCLAVWLCYSAHSTTDKILCVLFPITAFVAGGFEHSVANMYFVPLGLMLKQNYAAIDSSALTVPSFFLKNLLPVTLGNIAGGAAMVGLVYWFIYLRKSTVARA